MAGQRETVSTQWLITIVGGAAAALAILLIEKFIIDPLAPNNPWISIPVALATIILVIATARYGFIFNYGKKRSGSAERRMFDKLKTQLEAGGAIGEIYSTRLKAMLNAVDRFFGDADPAVKTLWPHAFGFTGQKPFWTAPAYDRCLLIALLYPLVMIYAMWGFSGHVGPGEAAVGLPDDAGGWRRLLAIGVILTMNLSFYAAKDTERWYNKIAAFALALAFATILTTTVDIIFGIGVGFGFVGALVGVFAFAGSGVVAITFAFVFAFLFSFAGTIVVNLDNYSSPIFAVISVFTLISVFTFSFAIGFAADYFDKRARQKNWHGVFLGLQSVGLLILCYMAAAWLGGSTIWVGAAPLLMFVGIFTLINAPFDWLTLGLTRALLRRGLELGGWWPLLLAIADLIMAAVVIVLLGAAMVIAVDAFNAVTVSAGGENVFDLAGTLNGLADPKRRSEPEYWWLYATLFSTLIPSIINVAVGALSVIRGVPGLHRMVAGAMMPGRGVLGANLWMAPALAFEVLVSVIIGTAAPLGLLWVLFGWLLPAFGTGLIPWLRVVEGLI